MQKYLFLLVYVGISVQPTAITAVYSRHQQCRHRLAVVCSTLFLDGGGDSAGPRDGPGDDAFVQDGAEPSKGPGVGTGDGINGGAGLDDQVSGPVSGADDGVDDGAGPSVLATVRRDRALGRSSPKDSRTSRTRFSADWELRQAQCFYTATPNACPSLLVRASAFFQSAGIADGRVHARS